MHKDKVKKKRKKLVLIISNDAAANVYHTSNEHISNELRLQREAMVNGPGRRASTYLGGLVTTANSLPATSQTPVRW